MGEFKEIKTQEELDNIIKERINREQAKYEEKLKNYNSIEKELIELKETTLKEQEKMKSLNNDLEKVNKIVEEYKLKEIKNTMAFKYNIPYELSDRLRGKTIEQIENDAENLSNLVRKEPAIQPLKDIENTQNSRNGFQILLENLNLKGE